MTDQALDQDRPQQIGVAIIGAGERGVYFIGSRIAEAAATSRLRIIGVQDRLPDRAALATGHLDAIYAAAGSDHATRVFPTLDAAVNDPQVDLVIVTTHTDSHRDPVEQAVAAGKRVTGDSVMDGVR